jgi:hypothetical protein
MLQFHPTDLWEFYQEVSSNVIKGPSFVGLQESLN